MSCQLKIYYKYLEWSMCNDRVNGNDNSMGCHQQTHQKKKKQLSLHQGQTWAYKHGMFSCSGKKHSSCTPKPKLCPVCACGRGHPASAYFLALMAHSIVECFVVFLILRRGFVLGSIFITIYHLKKKQTLLHMISTVLCHFIGYHMFHIFNFRGNVSFLLQF